MLTKNKITHLLDALATDLGQDVAADYLRFAVPRLAERRDALLAALVREHWAEAAALAHKTLGSVRSYDDGALEALLGSIEQQAVGDISQPTFQHDLQQVFTHLLATIEAWLQGVEA